MAKSNDIVLNQFNVGIGLSPDTGYGDMRNVDIFTQDSVIMPNYATIKSSGSTVTDLVKWLVRDPITRNIYGLGDSGNVYKYTGSWALIAGNTKTGANGEGLAVWKDYLFVARSAALDVMKISDETWTNGWQTLSATQNKFSPMLAGADDILYIGDGRNLISVEEVPGQTFAPGTGATYVYNSSALDLPSPYRIKCLTELGEMLAIGTTQGANVYEMRKADIFFWDRHSPFFELPISLAEFGVHQMLTVDNLIYIVAGLEGAIYISNGATAKFIRRLPRYVTKGASNSYFTFYPGAIIYHHDKIYFGFSTGTLASGYGGFGVWSLDRKGALVMANQISTGTTTSSENPLYIGALIATGADDYLISWRDNSTYGVDAIDTTNRYGSYATYIESPLLLVGTHMSKRTLSQVEIVLDKPLVSGQGVRISYRKNLVDAFTTLATFDFATYGGVVTENAPAPITDAVILQLKIELTTTSTPVYFKELRLR